MKTAVCSMIFLLVAMFVYPQVTDSTSRAIKLQGAVNFRDIGGYATKDGRHVKWGKIYRAAALNNLTNGDLVKLGQIGISYIADFRGPYEVSAAPDKIPATAIRASLPAGSENIGDSAYMKNMLQSIKGDDFLIEFYSNTTPFRDRYKPLFDELLQVNKDSAVLFHCSAGKDRTGIAATLILYALGVNEQTIIDDYLASNYYRKNENEKAVKGMVQLYKMDESIASSLMLVKENYIRSTFKAIKLKYGSMDIFLEKELGLTKERQELLKDKFLE